MLYFLGGDKSAWQVFVTHTIIHGSCWVKKDQRQEVKIISEKLSLLVSFRCQCRASILTLVGEIAYNI